MIQIVVILFCRNKNLEEHIASLEADLKSTSIDLYATREKFVYYKAESCGLHEEMTVINQVKAINNALKAILLTIH